MLNPTVEWWGETLPTYCHNYNSTWLNERGAELAVYRAWTDLTVAADRFLEVGNVLAHYPDLAHDGRVVDRYEDAPGVENIDVFEIQGEFDQIVAISTLEHVRWDEEPRLESGSEQAIEHLISLLAPGGRMLVTIPTGHHPHLDERLAFDGAGANACTLVRDMVSWRQTPTPEFRPYGVTQPWAEAVWIGTWSS